MRGADVLRHRALAIYEYGAQIARALAFAGVVLALGALWAGRC